MQQVELIAYQRQRLAAGTTAGLRDAAAAAVCFYCVRRSAEMLALTRDCVSEKGECFELHIKRQKNDPLGTGMRCWLPRVEALGLCCPFSLLQRWLTLHADTWGHESCTPLFFVTNVNAPRPLSYDSWRRSLANVFRETAVGTHSLRKGGAHWLKVQCQVPDDIIQVQGGWASKETMCAIYARFTCDEQQSMLLTAVRSATIQPPGAYHSVASLHPAAPEVCDDGVAAVVCRKPVWQRPL